ncbi:MAG: hypothetical protein ACRC6B_10660 [Fusobacteriaceae bacterium]
MTIIDGKHTLGGLGSQFYAEGSREAEIANAMAQTIEAGNSEEVLGAENLTALCMSMEEVLPRVSGQPIAVEISNVFFSEGGIQSEAQGFDTYYKNFTLKKGASIQAKAFSHDSKETLDARNKGISLLEKDAKDLRKITNAYAYRYNPNVRLLSLLTGSSLTTKVPTKATVGTDEDFCRAFGWVRGENVEDFIPSIYGVTHANHYRARKGAVIDKRDITDIIDLISRYDEYSGEGVIALANLRTIEDLGSLYKAPTNQDKVIIDGMYSPSFLGATWLEVPQLHPDFIIFLDAGKRDLIKRCVNNDEAQRGLRLIEENKVEGYKVESGINGMKAFIFEEEFIVASRFSGAILDIARQGDTEGHMLPASITELEKYTALVEGMYKK